MRYHHLKTYLSHQQRRLTHHREIMKRRMREDIHELEQEIALLARLIREIEHNRLHETTIKPAKPLTPKETMKRAERDRKRQERIRDVQASATKRITDIRSRVGK
jgi:pyruvate-formate lyase-activating enzyme